MRRVAFFCVELILLGVIVVPPFFHEIGNTGLDPLLLRFPSLTLAENAVFESVREPKQEN